MGLPKKVFISYKYSDVVEGRENIFNFRDDLIKRLGLRGLVHKGEDKESFDLHNYSEQQIIAKIAPYVKKSSITVVLISPNAKKSKWIPWEISMSLRQRVYKYEQNMTRNGIIGVYLPLNANLVPSKNGDYSFYHTSNQYGEITHHTNKFPKMIKDNSFNLINGAYPSSSGDGSSVYSAIEGSYIELVDWNNFISNIDMYIERAWDRRNKFDKYNIRIDLKEGK